MGWYNRRMNGGKTIKFSHELVPLIISGEKTATWRLWDDKDFRVGDKVTFIKKPELLPFAEAELVLVKQKTFGQIGEDDNDFMGHEQYFDMYKAYSDYYGKKVERDTPVKIIRFKILKLL